MSTDLQIGILGGIGGLIFLGGIIIFIIFEKQFINLYHRCRGRKPPKMSRVHPHPEFKQLEDIQQTITKGPRVQTPELYRDDEPLPNPNMQRHRVQHELHLDDDAIDVPPSPDVQSLPDARQLNRNDGTPPYPELTQDDGLLRTPIPPSPNPSDELPPFPDLQQNHEMNRVDALQPYDRDADDRPHVGRVAITMRSMGNNAVRRIDDSTLDFLARSTDDVRDSAASNAVLARTVPAPQTGGWWAATERQDNQRLRATGTPDRNDRLQDRILQHHMHIDFRPRVGMHRQDPNRENLSRDSDALLIT